MWNNQYLPGWSVFVDCTPVPDKQYRFKHRVLQHVRSPQTVQDLVVGWLSSCCFKASSLSPASIHAFDALVRPTFLLSSVCLVVVDPSLLCFGTLRDLADDFVSPLLLILGLFKVFLYFGAGFNNFGSLQESIDPSLFVTFRLDKLVDFSLNLGRVIVKAVE